VAIMAATLVCMDIRPVDPRDITWEIDDPRYRVTFWSAPTGGDRAMGWRSDEYEISGPGRSR